jgi:hypothetical protein
MVYDAYTRTESGCTAMVNLSQLIFCDETTSTTSIKEDKTTKPEETKSCNSETGFSQRTEGYKIRRRLLDEDSSIS